MTGLERIKNIMNGKGSDKIPWVPFAGVHAGSLVGYTAKEVSTDIDKLLEALKAVNKYYNPDGQPVMFDLQIEAEILGCDLVWSEDAPPSVSSHPLEEFEEEYDIPTTIPQPTDGRLKMELEAVRKMRQLYPDTALYGVCCGPFTLASHLRGTELFMDMLLNPEQVEKLLDWTTEVCKTVSTYLVEAGCDVVAVTDPLVSQISPAHFSEFLNKPFTAVFEQIRKVGGLGAFFVCGNATMNIEPMCKTKPDAISIDENVNLAESKKITDKYNITICGNIPLTSIMLFGTQQDNMACALELIDSVDSTDHLIVSPGCDMPYAIPIENTIGIQQTVSNPEETRTMLAGYKKTEVEFKGTIPDYANLKKPLVEIFTLDSATCAACTYMKEVAVEAVDSFNGKADWVEYKYCVADNIARCREMGVQKLPSIYINGKLCFSSIIPSRQELIDRISEVL